ncbi:tyrosine-type recombinase/integrase [Rothia sp. CCM 9417]|uniref:tyrosine-type recombinase/integrase n=1 Tax=Rothia sp. CCM 9417 TaxID=3402657 RepID=UPI003AE90809
MESVDDLLREYLAAYKNPRTLANKRRFLDGFLGKLASARLPLAEVTASFVEQHIRDEARGKGWGEGTVRSAQIELRLFLQRAHVMGFIPDDFTNQLRIAPYPPRTVQYFYSIEESQRILAEAAKASPSANRAVHLALLSGLRRGDIMRAHTSHLRQDGEHTLLHLPLRKGGAASTISLPEATVKTLPTSGPFIEFSQDKLYKEIRKIGERAGLSVPLRPHSMRASFITHALDAGVSERDVMLAAGHTRLSTTAYYDQGYKAARVGVSEAVAGRIRA